MTQQLAGLLFFAVTCVFVWGCGADDKCTTAGDCFSGEVCSSGTCVEAVGLNNSTVGGTSGMGAQTGGPTGTTGPGHGPNNGGGNNGNPSSNGSSNGVPNSNGNTTTTKPTTGLCVSDPFTAQCSVTSDGFYTYLRTDTGRGCLGGDDDFEGGTYVHETIEICPTETAHKYDTNLISCRTRVFFVEVIVTPLQACDRDDWDLNVRVQGYDYANPEDRVRCEPHEDGVSKRVIARIEPETSITIPKIDITPLIENMQFEYNVSITVRE